MNLHDFELFTDENIAPEIVLWLREAAFNVLDAKEAGLVGVPDRQLLATCQATRRVALTHDRDFGKLVVSGGEPFTGIVFLRPGHIDPQFTIGSLQALLDSGLDLEPPFLVVVARSRNTVRIRLRRI